MNGGCSMFRNEHKALYKYFTEKELKEPFTIDNVKRKNMILWKFEDVSWVTLPLEVEPEFTSENMLDYFDGNDKTLVFFIDSINSDGLDIDKCRKLEMEDKKIFDEFHNSCSKEDQEEGQVSIEDDFVYGLFDNEKLVAVCSLWNWGDISDIGILVHPDYRYKGYAKTVCTALMLNANRTYLWRCEQENKGSHKLALSIGFKEVGFIKTKEIKNGS